MPIVFFLLLLVTLMLEGTIIVLPLSLSVLLIMYVLSKDTRIVFVGLVAGLVLDAMLVRQFGLTSLFISVFLLVVHLYERKFEVTTYPFVIFASTAGTMLYSIVFTTPVLLGQLVISIVASIILYLLMKKLVGNSYATTRKPL